MKTKLVLLLATLFVISTNSNAQLGIRGGLNMANEIQSFNNEGISSAFNSKNLTGYHIGLVYQLNPKKSGIGFEIGALLSQKGGVFKVDKTDVVNSLIKGYHEINYVEMPLNLRYRLSFGGVVGAFASAGVYGAYALKGKTVFESDIASLTKADSFDNLMSRIDYGYSFGAGVEFIKKIQIGFNWSQGLQKRDASKSILDKITTESGSAAPNLQATNTSRVFSVTLTYLF